jgi:hypothetical protein
VSTGIFARDFQSYKKQMDSRFLAIYRQRLQSHIDEIILRQQSAVSMDLNELADFADCTWVQPHMLLQDGMDLVLDAPKIYIQKENIFKRKVGKKGPLVDALSSRQSFNIDTPSFKGRASIDSSIVGQLAMYNGKVGTPEENFSNISMPMNIEDSYREMSTTNLFPERKGSRTPSSNILQQNVTIREDEPRHENYTEGFDFGQLAGTGRIINGKKVFLQT